jgi:DNA-binding transcriptional ArsR family regulator
MEPKKIIDALSALAQDSRLALFRLLVRCGPQGLPAGAIAEQLDIPAPTLSFHLGQLARAGLVSSRREGRSIIYAADFAGMNALVAYLTENCCRGDMLCNPDDRSIPVSSIPGESRHETPARRARGR